jgi:hypothetical protein
LTEVNLPDGSIDRRIMERLMFGTGRVRRFTQDSPVLPDVWIEYAKSPEERGVALTGTAADEMFGPVRLLLTPYRATPAGDVAIELRKRLKEDREKRKVLQFTDPKAPARVIYNQSSVAADLYFEDVIRVVLPMTDWWHSVVEKWPIESLESVAEFVSKALIDPEHAPAAETKDEKREPLPAEVLWLVRVVGALAYMRHYAKLPQPFDDYRKVATAQPADWMPLITTLAKLLKNIGKFDPLVYSVSMNRDAGPTVTKSTLAIKADAARRVFDLSCADLRWGIIDSGVDARHPAFRKRTKGQPLPPPFETADKKPRNNTRVVATFDFTGLDILLDPENPDVPERVRKRIAEAPDAPALNAAVTDLNLALNNGRTLDWKLIRPLLEIPHKESEYEGPPFDHGTHVAGILAGDWHSDDAPSSGKENLIGVCPDLELYDLRVLNAQGHGDEFSVMAALQFVRWLNSTNDYMAVHGVNMSLSIPHDVANYACGRTPVCDEAERVVSSGIIVVVAAGNQGFRKYTTEEGQTAEAYNSISITDPGNAELVITVGATHRYRPHMYGVSYFSSRGPTGDGRVKPDLVAPGEKITAPLPDNAYGLRDGTSMAAPHVSGAAALLLARYNELIGRPQRIKQILCSTATDLGRERYFQGAGMLDVLRALQSI